MTKAMIGSNAKIGESAEIGATGEDAMNDFLNTKICSDGISLIAPEVSIADGVKIGVCSMVTEAVNA